MGVTATWPAYQRPPVASSWPTIQHLASAWPPARPAVASWHKGLTFAPGQTYVWTLDDGTVVTTDAGTPIEF